MKVLMTTDAVGGVWTYATELADALDAEVVLAVVGPNAPAGALAHPGRLEWQQDPWDDLAAQGEWLRGLVAEHRPAVVHLNQFAFGALGLGVPTLVVAHSDVCSWHVAVHGTEAGPEWDRYRETVRAGLRGADAVVAPSRAMAGAVAAHFGVQSSVIGNGIAPRRGGGGQTPSTGVLAAGRLWDAAKGLDAIDGAARIARLPIAVAGDAGGAGAAHAELLGVLAREELRERMRAAAIFAHPARYEPFGLAPLEAAAEGCALVLGNIASLRELWDGCALFVPPGDAEALATALDLLDHDDALRARLAARAQARAQERTAARMAQDYGALYAALARTAVTA